MQLAPLGLALSQRVAASPEGAVAIPDNFPTQAPEMVREMVQVSHGNVKRVRELVEAHPALAKASWDWGFGDWETALGAASHVGNREIAEYLLGNGAPPTLYSATMLGQLDVVKAIIAANPGAQRMPGPHSIPLLAHARVGGERAKAVLEYLTALGDAGAPAAAPLTDEETEALKGTYRFGVLDRDRIDITIDRKALVFTRPGMPFGRGLTHMGDHVFHPAGARAVRIRFAEADGKMELTVHDPDLVLRAVRVKS